MQRTKRRHLQFDSLEAKALLSGVHPLAIHGGGGHGPVEIRQTDPSGRAGGGQGGYPNGEAFTGARIFMNGGAGGYLFRVPFSAKILKNGDAGGYLFGSTYSSARHFMNGGVGGYLNGVTYYSARHFMNGGVGGYVNGAAGIISTEAT